MTHIHTSTAIERFEAWLGTAYDLSPAVFGVVESMREMCSADSVVVRASGDDSATSIALYQRNAGEPDAWLWALELFGPHARIALRVSPNCGPARTFLSNLLCEAHATVDADQLVLWWQSKPGVRPSSITASLPSNADDLADVFAQLERATLDSAMSYTNVEGGTR